MALARSMCGIDCFKIAVMSDPTHVQKLLYLGGKRVSNEEHREWLMGILDGQDQRKLGALLALPNALVMMIFALLSFAIGDLSYGIFLIAGATVVLITGASIPFLIRGRTKNLTRRNNF